MVMQAIFLSKYSVFGIVINPCTAKSGYFQNNINYISATKTQLYSVMSHLRPQ